MNWKRAGEGAPTQQSRSCIRNEWIESGIRGNPQRPRSMYQKRMNWKNPWLSLWSRGLHCLRIRKEWIESLPRSTSSLPLCLLVSEKNELKGVYQWDMAWTRWPRVSEKNELKATLLNVFGSIAGTRYQKRMNWKLMLRILERSKTMCIRKEWIEKRRTCFSNLGA